MPLSRGCRSGTPSYDPDHISCDLQEPTGYLEALDAPRAADFNNSLAQKGHERRVPWEYPYEAVVGGRHDGVGVPVEYRTLGRDNRDAHQADAIFLACATTSSIAPCM